MSLEERITKLEKMFDDLSKRHENALEKIHQLESVPRTENLQTIIRSVLIQMRHDEEVEKRWEQRLDEYEEERCERMRDKTSTGKVWPSFRKLTEAEVDVYLWEQCKHWISDFLGKNGKISEVDVATMICDGGTFCNIGVVCEKPLLFAFGRSNKSRFFCGGIPKGLLIQERLEFVMAKLKEMKKKDRPLERLRVPNLEQYSEEQRDLFIKKWKENGTLDSLMIIVAAVQELHPTCEIKGGEWMATLLK